jgi:hypothetical protein
MESCLEGYQTITPQAGFPERICEAQQFVDFECKLVSFPHLYLGCKLSSYCIYQMKCFCLGMETIDIGTNSDPAHSNLAVPRNQVMSYITTHCIHNVAPA